MNEQNYRVYLVNELDDRLYHHCHRPVSMKHAFEMMSWFCKSEDWVSKGIGDEFWQAELKEEGIVRMRSIGSSLVKAIIIGPQCIHDAVELYNRKIDAGEWRTAKISAGDPSKVE